MAKNYTKKQVIEAVKNSRGIVSVVARHLGCEWHTARRYIDKYQEALEVERSEREVLCDQAESTLIGMLKSNDEKVKFNASTYILDRLANKRGYSPKQEIDHTTSDGSMKPNVIELVAYTGEGEPNAEG